MKQKHILRAIFAGILVTTQSVMADTFGDFTYTDNGASITITDYPDTKVGMVEIPAEIAGKPVTSIGNFAFASCSNLTSITIPNSVTTIGIQAFSSCANLTSMTIPNSVTTIGRGAFYVCYDLMSITISNRITSIGDYAFDGCSKLTKVYFLGNAPIGEPTQVFNNQVTVFYRPGTTGWTSTFLGRPTILWAPAYIATHPQSKTLELGETIVFEITTDPKQPKLPETYQWYHNGVAIPEANSVRLTLANVTTADAGKYKILVTNEAGTVESTTATLSPLGETTYNKAQYEAALGIGFNLGLQAVTASPNNYGLYNLNQIQNLHLSTPLLQKDQATGKFKLTIKAQKTTDLTSFSNLSFSNGQTTINSAGEVEFLFDSNDNAAFFRIQGK